MKKLITLSVLITLMLLTGSLINPAHSQDAAKDEKPTFYHLTPGTYVNGYPRFTMAYPKDWIERPIAPASGDVFFATTPGTYRPGSGKTFRVGLNADFRLPLDKYADDSLPFFKALGLRDVTVARNNPSQLRDGTPAQEVEIHYVVNGVPNIHLILLTKKGDVLIRTSVATDSGKIGEDLKAILYSIEFEPDKDKPLKVPPDVQEFFNMLINDILSHDVDKIVSHYSDNFLNSGTRKGEVERLLRTRIGYWTAFTSLKTVITDFVGEGDKAYFAGFVVTSSVTFSTSETSIIKENGEWKFYGNQREVVR